MTTAISFHGVTKHYRGAREYRALRDDLAGAVGRIAGRKRPPRTPVRALEDVSFEIPEGQSFALIGANGAGKTTALRIASRITYPTTGRVRVRGRVGALIEVGTGLHPELSGRENVSLHGRILGLSRRDIQARFDQIVEFAEVASRDRPPGEAVLLGDAASAGILDRCAPRAGRPSGRRGACGRRRRLSG